MPPPLNNYSQQSSHASEANTFHPSDIKNEFTSHRRSEMETSGNRDSGSSNEVQSWTSFLNREMAEAKEGDPVKYRLLKIIRDTLLSTNEFRAAEGAKLIDSYHRYEYFAADLSLKYLEDTGTSPFLCRLYSLLTDVSSVIPYTDPNQGGLVQLLVELRKLPQTSCMIVNVRSSPPNVRPSSQI